MAATITLGNPIVVTGGVASYKTFLAAQNPGGGINNTSFGTLTVLIIEKIRWVNPGISQTLSINDPISQKVLWQCKSDTTGEDVMEDFTANPMIWSDFYIDVFVGGTLLLYTN